MLNRPLGMLVVGGAFFVACVGDSSPPAPDASTDATTPDTSTSDAATDVVQDVPVDAAFNPATLGNLQLWVAADVGLALSGGKMTWTDQSPQSHLVQSPNDSSPCSNPTIQTAAINGLSAASFDGHTNCFTVSSGFNDFTNGVSIFVVAQPQNHNSPFLGAESAFVDLSGSSAAQSAEVLFGRAYQPTNTSTGDFQLQTNNTSTTTGLIDTGSGDTYLSGVTHLFEVVLPALPEDQSGTGTLYEDGTVTGAATNNPLGPTIAARAYNFIGWNAWEQVNSYPAYSGLIGEILVYSSALTTSQRQSLEAHLKSKWGL